MRGIHSSSHTSVVTNDVVMTGNKLVSHEIGLSIQIFWQQMTIDKDQHLFCSHKRKKKPVARSGPKSIAARHSSVLNFNRSKNPLNAL